MVPSIFQRAADETLRRCGDKSGAPVSFMDAMDQIEQVEQFLDGLGSIAEGDTLVDRVTNAVVYYATQMGRWVAENKKPTRKETTPNA